MKVITVISDLYAIYNNKKEKKKATLHVMGFDFVASVQFRFKGCNYISPEFAGEIKRYKNWPFAVCPISVECL